MKYSSISKLYWAWDYLSKLEWKLIHVSKSGPWKISTPLLGSFNTTAADGLASNGAIPDISNNNIDILFWNISSVSTGMIQIMWVNFYKVLFLLLLKCMLVYSSKQLHVRPFAFLKLKLCRPSKAGQSPWQFLYILTDFNFQQRLMLGFILVMTVYDNRHITSDNLACRYYYQLIGDI